MGKTLRIFLYLFALLCALWIGGVVYSTTFDILSFQIDLYKYLLQGKELVNSAGNAAQEVVSGFMGLFGEGGKEIEKIGTTNTIEQRLADFSAKLKTISLLLGTIIGSISYLLITKILFGIKSHIISLKEFIS